MTTECDYNTVFGVYYTSFSGNDLAALAVANICLGALEAFLFIIVHIKFASAYSHRLPVRRLANIRDSALPHLSHKSAP